MGSGRVTFVLREAILRILLIQFCHNAVTRDLGDDGSGGDGADITVSLDDAHLILIPESKIPSIDQKEIRLWLQSFHSTLHRQKISLADIQPVNFLCRCNSDAITD